MSTAINFEAVKYEKTTRERAFIQSVLEKNFLFMDLKENDSKQFIDAMQKEKVPAGMTIIEQGTIGDFFYIIETGRVIFTDGGEEVGEAGPGDSFGELALLYDSPRAVSCLAKSPTAVVLWKVDQHTFRHLVVRNAHDRAQGVKDLLGKIEIFRGLDDSSLSCFADALTPVTWEADQRIVEKGHEGTVFYIIESGNVRVHDIGLGDSQFEDQKLGPGDWFGERALVTGEPRAANVTAIDRVTTLAIDRKTFERTVGPMKDAVDLEMKEHFLKSIPIFSKGGIADPEIKQLAKLLQEICFKKGTMLVKAGTPVDPTLYILRHGRLLVFNQKQETVNSLDSGDYFGDKSLHWESDHVNKTSAVCEEDLTAWVLSRAKLESVIGNVSRLGHSRLFAKAEREKSVSLLDLKKVKVLGMGAFGEVWLVSDVRKKDTTYALKSINKRKLLDSKQDLGVIREKEFLSLLEHPFILHLVSSFQDEMNLYLLLPVIPGGELFSVLHHQRRKNSGLVSKQAAFYSACIVEALGHFHQR